MSEADDIAQEFTRLLRGVIEDGQRKRRAGKKVLWKYDPGHAAALHRHLTRWDLGEYKDEDSGCHPLVHAAFRCLAIAYQEERDSALARQSILDA